MGASAPPILYRRASSRCVCDKLPWSSPTCSPMSPRRMCMRWACFLVWVNSITWSVKVLVNRAGKERRTSWQLPLTRTPSLPARWPPCLARGRQAKSLLVELIFQGGDRSRFLIPNSDKHCESEARMRRQLWGWILSRGEQGRLIKKL